MRKRTNGWPLQMRMMLVNCIKSSIQIENKTIKPKRMSGRCFLEHKDWPESNWIELNANNLYLWLKSAHLYNAQIHACAWRLTRMLCAANKFLFASLFARIFIYSFGLWLFRSHFQNRNRSRSRAPANDGPKLNEILNALHRFAVLCFALLRYWFRRFRLIIVSLRFTRRNVAVIEMQIRFQQVFF